MDLESVDEIDLNKIFNLTYTFDTLKVLLGNFSKNQKTMVNKINELEEELKKVRKKNIDLEKGIIQVQNNSDKKIKSLEIILTNMKKKEKEMNEKNKENVSPVKEPQPPQPVKVEEKKEEPKVEEKKEEPKVEEKKEETKVEEKKEEPKVEEKKEEPPQVQEQPIVEEKKEQEIKPLIIPEENLINSNNNKQGELIKEEPSNINISRNDEDEEGPLFLNDNIEVEDLKRRVTDLEKKVKTLSNKRFQNSNNNNQNTEGLDIAMTNIKNLSDMMGDIKDTSDTLVKDVDELKIKVDGLNVADLFKDAKVDNGNIDGAKLLVLNLEKKVFSKFGLYDDKFKKDEEDIYKMKNEIVNLKNLNETYKRNIANINDDIKKLIEEMQNTNESNETRFSDLENKFNDSLKKILTRLDEDEKNNKKEFDDLKNKINKLIENSQNNNKQTQQNSSSLTGDDLKFIKQLNNKTNELEKNFKNLVNILNLEELRDDVKYLKREMIKKCNQDDFFDVNDKVTNIINDVQGIKETDEKLIEDTAKCFNDINFLIKKFEVLNSAVINLKTVDDNSNKNISSMIDTSKFLEINSFNEFLKSYTKEHDRLHREIDDLKRYLDEIADALKTRVSEEDLKNLESIIMSKIDELNIRLNKKFADKIDTTKSIKYLDTQIKHIIDVYIKSKEKGDNWLIAKKPIGGYSCASCEAYLGELKDKDEYLAWNKYPMRDSQDKAYRIGNGFSRMLNLLNLDVKNSYENNGGADDDHRRNSSEKKQHSSGSALPQIKRKGEGNTCDKNNSNVNLEVNNTNFNTYNPNSDGEDNNREPSSRPGPNDPRV